MNIKLQIKVRRQSMGWSIHVTLPPRVSRLGTHRRAGGCIPQVFHCVSPSGI